ncbi:hypothetical protein EDD21DRAFT_374746 [Dissophora ornata]|nr:hypothetical protein EDD21DRAFT_374746 [Dissophora ornata]
MINNDDNRSLEALPMSPCTDGSLGFDHHFIASSTAKANDDNSSILVNEHVLATAEETNEGKNDVTEEHAMEHMHERGEDHAMAHIHEKSDLTEEHAMEHMHEKSDLTEEHSMEHMEKNGVTEEHAVEHKREKSHVTEKHTPEHKEKEKEPVEEMHQAVGHKTEEEAEHENEHENEDIEEMTEMTCTMAVSSSITADSETTEVTFTTTSVAPAATTTKPKTMATEAPHCPVKSDASAAVQTRAFSNATLALKKKQAAEEATATTKTTSVNAPETDSIADRIKIFGGACTGRVVYRKVGVRDMIKKYKDVEDKSHSEIAHVVRGHNESEPRGVCSAYSLSTASRPLRPTPVRKMSHEMANNETRQVVKSFGGMARHDEDDRLGVIQESVHSVKNAKSIFESLARSKSGAQV